MNLLDVLKRGITEATGLPELIDAFEKMCRIPIETVDPQDDLLLFETGVFAFSGKPAFHFSLVRQFPNGEDEYTQIHLDVEYAPSLETQGFSQAVWNEEIEGDFFTFVRSSPAYQTLKGQQIANIDVYMDDT